MSGKAGKAAPGRKKASPGVWAALRLLESRRLLFGRVLRAGHGAYSRKSRVDLWCPKSVLALLRGQGHC